MPHAVDTIGLAFTAGAASPFPTPFVALAGDNLAIRNFPLTSRARINWLTVSEGGGQKFQIKSPLLHDNVTGFTFQPAEVPAMYLFPPDAPIGVQPVDTLVVNGGLAAAGTAVAALSVDYDDLPGAKARLFSYADIRPHVKNYKSVEVDLLAVTAGLWQDTPITNTEDQLHSNSDYAVLGWQTTAALDVVGVKGIATSNLRHCGPGNTSTLDVTSFFIYMSEQTGKPQIPVFNANDRKSFNISCLNHAAIGAGAQSVYLMVAELSTQLPS